MTWLMLQSEIDRIEALEASAPIGIEIEAAVKQTPVTAKRGVAQIQVRGPLSSKRRPILEIFGVEYAVYSDITGQLSSAERKGAKSAELHFDTPGGQTDGMYEAMLAIKGASIPTRAIVHGTCASAGYMLASQCDEIIATNEGAILGSIGVMVTVSREKTVVNPESPNKNPDATTQEGKTSIQGQLSDLFALYAERIAEGRNTTIDNVKSNYGQGGIMTARTALSKGMIDGIIKDESKIFGQQSNQPAKPAATIGAKSMNMEELKAEHPALYALVFAAGETAGTEAATTNERKRVLSHLKMADASGDTATAMKAIEDGAYADMDAMIHHQFFSKKAEMRKNKEADNAGDLGSDAPHGGAGDAAAADAAATAKLNAEYGDDTVVM